MLKAKAYSPPGMAEGLLSCLSDKKTAPTTQSVVGAVFHTETILFDNETFLPH